MGQPALVYSDESDEAVYLDTTMAVGDTHVSIQAATTAGSTLKPNEDTFAVCVDKDVLIAGVFDGSTSLKSIEGLGGQTGARFASHFLKQNLALVDSKLSPRALLLELNKRLLKKSQELAGVTLEDTLGLPSSLATVVKIDFKRDEVSLAHVGDSYCLVFYNDGRSVVLTDDRVEPFDAKVYALQRQIAQEQKITLRAARDDKRIQQAFQEMYRERNNNPNGQGSGFIDGNPDAALYIQSITIQRSGVKALLLGSDGLAPQGWSIQRERDRQKLLSQVKTGGFQKLIATKRKSEDDDPDWTHIRFKHSDDATGLLIQFD